MGESLSSQWFELVQTAGIVAGLLLTAASLRQEAKARRVSNLITLTAQHREIWTKFLSRPSLSRVLDTTADTDIRPVSAEERTFLKFLIVHFLTAYRASCLNETVSLGKLGEEAGTFFTLPIPGAVWDEVKSVHDDDFVEFVERERKKTRLNSMGQ